MTAAQSRALAVALDGLKHEGVDPADVVRALYDAETAARMLRAVDGEIEASLRHFMTTFDQPDAYSQVARGDSVIELRRAARRLGYLGGHLPFSPAATPAAEALQAAAPTTSEGT